MKNLPNVQPINMRPRVNMAKGDLTAAAIAAGRNLPGRMKDLSNKVLGRDNIRMPLKDKRIQSMADDIFGTDQQIMNIGRGQTGGLFNGARDLNRIRNTENAIMAGGGLGVAGMIDATNMFSEPASVDNISFMSPEAMGTDLANLRVGIDKVIDLARNKASEMGADINEYVGRTKSAYDQQMENQRMQELDAEQGMQPFSMLMGPDMPLFRPAERTVSDMDRATLDDILSDLEKKKLDSPPQESISLKDVTDIFFDPTDPLDYAALGGGPFIKAGLSAKKAKRLYDSLQRIRQRKRQAQVDFKRGQAEDRVGELGGRKLMKKSSDTFKELSINEEKILKQLEGYQPELL